MYRNARGFINHKACIILIENGERKVVRLRVDPFWHGRSIRDTLLPVSNSELLTRGVASVIPKELAEQKLKSKKKLRVYLGIDPTGTKLHIGHTIPLRKLQQFAEAGHHAIFLVGSFTAMIGDPSDKEAVRKKLTQEEVKKNFHSYQTQASKVLDFSKVEIRFNHEWHEKMGLETYLEIASHFTKQQIEQRDMFRRREKEGKPIAFHELSYPLLQGYDSVMLDVDCEIGGTDQEFNMLAGRSLQKAYGTREKFILTTKLIEGTDCRLMSKTYNNCIYLEDEPNDMFGKMMSLKDECMDMYFECCTDVSTKEYKELLKGSLRVAKARLASEIVTLYHGQEKAKKAEEEFIKVFTEKGTPKDIPERPFPEKDLLGDLVSSGLVSSKSDARRLLTEKGIKVLNEKGDTVLTAESEAEIVEIMAKGLGNIVKIGKRKFLRYTKNPPIIFNE